jgi:hypothetical protein
VVLAAARTKQVQKIAHGTSELIFLGLKKYLKPGAALTEVNQIVHTEFGVVHEHLVITPILSNFSWFTKRVPLKWL